MFARKIHLEGFRWFLFILLLPLLCENAYGEIPVLETWEGSDLTVKYEKPLKDIVPKVLKAYPRARTALGKKLGFDISFKPVIVLIHTDHVFNRMAGGNSLVNAFAVSNINHIYIDYSKMERTPFDLELTLTHELCHLLLHEYIKPYRLPRWLNEGVSQWVSGGISDIINYDGKKLLKEAVLSGNYLPLDELVLNFPREANWFKLSYEESKSLVEYIDDEYGADQLLLILEYLRKGDNINKAVLNSLSVDLNRLEDEWHTSLRIKYTWYSYFADNLLWILFSGAALLTVIGYIRLRIRMKTHFKDEEDDEEYP